MQYLVYFHAINFDSIDDINIHVLVLENGIVVSSNPVHGEVYSIQHYVIKFGSDLRQVSGFLQALQFPPPIKLTTTI
jgi:hypothetical protein